jgi:hypothetical protein
MEFFRKLFSRAVKRRKINAASAAGTLDSDL